MQSLCVDLDLSGKDLGKGGLTAGRRTPMSAHVLLFGSMEPCDLQPMAQTWKGGADKNLP